MIDAWGYLSADSNAAARFAVEELPLRSRDAAHATESESSSSLAASVAHAAGSRETLQSELRSRRLAAEILTAVQSRLPGRIHDLRVRVEGAQFVLSGVSSSYYVKQMAQHIAMTALEAVRLAQLVNEIEVRAPR